MAAYMRNVRFYIPTEAAGSLLRLVMNQLCAGRPMRLDEMRFKQMPR